MIIAVFVCNYLYINTLKLQQSPLITKSIDTYNSSNSRYLPNDLAYSILSEIAAYENLNEELMQLIFEKGDKGCKVAICLNKNLPHKLQEHCKRSSDGDIKEHFQQRE